MNRPLDTHLARWEAGALSLDELQRLHPQVDVAALTSLHARLNSFADAPAPDPEETWLALAAGLPARAAATTKSRRLRRPAIAAIIAGLLSIPTVAYAAAPDAVRSVVREVTDLIPGVNNDGDHNDKDDDEAPITGTDDGNEQDADTPGDQLDDQPDTDTEDVDQPDVDEPDTQDVDQPDVDEPDTTGADGTLDVDEDSEGSQEGDTDGTGVAGDIDGTVDATDDD